MHHVSSEIELFIITNTDSLYFLFHSDSVCKMSITYIINESSVSLWSVDLEQFTNFSLF